jgi:hypothetical protein
MATFVAGVSGIDFDLLDLGPLAIGQVTSSTATSQEIRVGSVISQFFGVGFQFSGGGPPSAGTINRIVIATDAGLAYDISGLNLSASTSEAGCWPETMPRSRPGFLPAPTRSPDPVSTTACAGSPAPIR